MQIKIAPSILSADFSKLGLEIKAAELAGADLIHVDVMDGHFVDNITIGPLVIKALRKITALPLDVHLMIEHPMKYIKAFAEAGSDIISFHLEAKDDAGKVIAEIKKCGKTPAIALNPDTSPEKAFGYLKDIKMVLLMTVFPGFEGQKFIPSVLPAISILRDKITSEKLDIDIEVDGGINASTSSAVIQAGANVLVAGSAVFYSSDYKSSIEAIRRPS